VVNVAAEIAQAGERGRISSRGKANAGYEPVAVNFGAVRALDEPLVATLVKSRTVNVLVVGYMGRDIPFLVDELEIFSELLPASISLAKGPLFP
jgi:hypothetical protein